MKRWKLNISPRYFQGLAALLVIACLLLATGVTWARYRMEMDGSVYFETRKPVSVYLGRVEYSESETVPEEVPDETAPEELPKGEFVQTDEGNWELGEDGKLHLKFAVANGISETDFEERTQNVYLRFVGSLGAQTAGNPISLSMSIPQKDKPEELVQVKAEAVPIVPEAPLYTTFGEGWVFCFMVEGQELTWKLKGGELSIIEMDVTLEDGTLADTSLLQLQVSSRYISD